jgi:lysyl oxidase
VSRRLAASIVVLGGGLAPGCGAPADAHDAPPGDVGAAPRDARVSLDAPVALVDASPFDAAPQVPDLQFVAGEMASTFVVTADPFAADDCAVMEGCVGGAGTRILLRFDTVTANRGSGDLVVGVPPPPGESDAVFQWSPCHMHHHVANYASYELIDTTGTVLTARKQSFCLEDGEQVQPGAPPTGYSCLNQGISRGWADVYSRYLPCQWIDVTDLPSGTYTLRIVVNPLHTIPESDYDNNVFTASVQF